MPTNDKKTGGCKCGGKCGRSAENCKCGVKKLPATTKPDTSKPAPAPASAVPSDADKK
ncbi:hypothetical protein BH11CYA1_BH11CYA1_38510 [soil metagenome]